MRKRILLFSLATLFVFGPAVTGYALELGLGFQYGPRTVSDSNINDVYGNGTAYFTSLRFVLGGGLEIGAGYEAGYERNGVIGLYQEKTTLRVTGYEVFAGYGFRIHALEPYLRLGYGRYVYKQEIESGSMPFKVDDTKSGPTLAAGLRVHPWKGAWLSLEAKYVPLKVKPVDLEVDLGGWRLALGAGYSIKL
jgi:hypothetical protein